MMHIVLKIFTTLAVLGFILTGLSAVYVIPHPTTKQTNFIGLAAIVTGIFGAAAIVAAIWTFL